MSDSPWEGPEGCDSDSDSDDCEGHSLPSDTEGQLPFAPPFAVEVLSEDEAEAPQTRDSGETEARWRRLCTQVEQSGLNAGQLGPTLLALVSCLPSRF